jgi:nitroimidazol reductase NimA-like FMN-containing flavoprotein (pyridoxamine 5'-phosphate oxidase superfamily)
MKRTDHIYISKAVAILHRIQYATLATVTPGGLPWNSPVYAVIDNDLRVYWISDKEGQHSRNVRHNGEVFIVVYDSTVSEGQGQGVYIRAKARELEDAPEIRRVRTLKKGETGESPSLFQDNGVRRVYEAVPERIWINAAEVKDGVFIRDYRIELELHAMKSAFRRQD